MGLIDGSFDIGEHSTTHGHAHIAAFLRMLTLFPDFTVSLVKTFNGKDGYKVDDQYRPELFVAYEIMARLVDKKDRNVMQSTGIDEYYLCH